LQTNAATENIKSDIAAAETFCSSRRYVHHGAPPPPTDLTERAVE
jgi:hypothetical protein